MREAVGVKVGKEVFWRERIDASFSETIQHTHECDTLQACLTNKFAKKGRSYTFTIFSYPQFLGFFHMNPECTRQRQLRGEAAHTKQRRLRGETMHTTTPVVW